MMTRAPMILQTHMPPFPGLMLLFTFSDYSKGSFSHGYQWQIDSRKTMCPCGLKILHCCTRLEHSGSSHRTHTVPHYRQGRFGCRAPCVTAHRHCRRHPANHPCSLIPSIKHSGRTVLKKRPLQLSGLVDQGFLVLCFTSRPLIDYTDQPADFQS